MAKEWFGRIPEPDDRDSLYPARSLLTGPHNKWQYWWDLSHFGNQGRTPHCVEYAWWHAIMDGPLTKARTHNIERAESGWLYREAQERDAWEGEYDGTSVRGGAKALKDHGMIDEYRWCKTTDEVIHTILEYSPVVMGTRWPDSFMSVDDEGYVTFSEEGDAGHAYVLNGANIDREVVRIKNSWGRDWGDSGRAWLTFQALEQLMNEPHSEACVVVTY